MWVDDKVRLVRVLGRGSMGEVWVGFHRSLKTEVAVKLILDANADVDAAMRFTREARAAAKINDPHVVRIFDHGSTAEGVPYIVMELLDGVTLQQRLTMGRLSIQQTLRIAEQVGRALDAAHRAGVIHRDVKPQNVFLLSGGDGLYAKLVDFGSALLRIPGARRETRPNLVVGSPAYMSRDVLLDPEAVDPQLDLWGLSATLYKCLTGSLPFMGKNVATVCAAIIDGRLRRPSRLREGLSPLFDAWFAKAFHIDPERRPQSGTELARTFREVVEATQPRSRRPPLWPIYAASLLMPVAAGATVLALRAGAVVPMSRAASLAGAVTPPPIALRPEAPVRIERPLPAEVDDRRLRLAAARILVPGGISILGCRADDCEPGERPERRAEIGAFAIDRTEVTVRDYAACVRDGACDSEALGGYRLDGPFVPSPKCNWGHPARHNHPINCVTYHQARSYCAWAGGRLPSEDEWERAARGDDGRRYPWGDGDPSCQRAVMSDGPAGCRAEGTWPAGTKRIGASPFGVLDLAGNVREWVEGSYQPNDPSRVGRGGSWGNAVGRYLRASARERLDPSTRSIHLGFRCASDR